DAGDRIVVHDPAVEDPSAAFALSRLSQNPTGPTPLGIFRSVNKPVYEDLLHAQIDEAIAAKGPGELKSLVAGSNTWTVEA
ncbi:MAG: 2-oxoglutarate ferredoxin oxidoreductase subunit beta, partial [Glaciecola sp.]